MNEVSMAFLVGTKGRIRIHPQMFRPTKLTLALTGQEDNTIEIPLVGNGYNYEAAEVMHCLQAGKLESDTMPLDETLAIMKTMDQIRAQWGLRYPMEAPPSPPKRSPELAEGLGGNNPKTKL